MPLKGALRRALAPVLVLAALAAGALPARAQCVSTVTVTSPGTIQAGVNSLPGASWTSDQCLLIEPGTYAEVVTIAGFANNGFRLYIASDTTAGGAVVVSTSNPGAAAFYVGQDSVTIVGLTFSPSGAVGSAVSLSSNSDQIVASTVSASAGNGVSMTGSRGALVSDFIYSNSGDALSVSGAALSNAVDFSTLTTVSGSAASLTGGQFTSLLGDAISGRGGAAVVTGVASSSDVFTGLIVSCTGGETCFNVNSNGNAVASSTITASNAGLTFNNASSNTLTSSYLYSISGPALTISADAAAGASGNSVSVSTMATVSGNAVLLREIVGPVSGNGFVGDVIESLVGGITANLIGDDHTVVRNTAISYGGSSAFDQAFELDLSSYDSVTQSVVSAAGGAAAIFLKDAVFNSFGGDVVTAAGGGVALTFDSDGLGVLSSGNSVSGSSLTAAGADALAVWADADSSDSVTGSVLTNTAGGAVALTGGSSSDTFSSDQIAGASSALPAFVVASSSRNLLSQDAISNAAGIALAFDANGSFNQVVQSTLTSDAAPGAGGPFLAALWQGGNNNVVSAVISNPAGVAAFFTRADTLPNDGSFFSSTLISGASSNTLDASTISGSTGVWISGGAVNTTIDGGSLSGSGANAGLWMQGGFGLSVAGSTVSAAAGGVGIFLDSNNTSALTLSTVTVTGAKDGLIVSTPSVSGATLSGTEVEFSGLASGATAMLFIGGTWTTTFSGTDFADAGLGVNVSAAALFPPGSAITLSASTGTKAGPSFDVDPHAVVSWPGVNEFPPGSPAVAAVYVSSVAVSWTSVASNGYELDASTSALFSGAFASSVTLDGAAAGLTVGAASLSPNTTYFLRAGALWPGTTLYAAALVTATLAPAVSGVQTAVVTAVSLTASWTALPASPSSMTAEGYVVEASTAANFTGTVFVSPTGGAGTTSLTVSGLNAATTYYYAVGALNWNNAVDFAAPLSTVTGTGVAPGSPFVNLVSASGITVDWTPVSAVGYELDASTSANFGGTVFVSSVAGASAAGLTVGMPPLAVNTTYFLRAGAILAGGATVYASPALSTATLAAAPGAPALGAVNASSVTVSWTQTNPAGTFYQVRYWTAGGSTSSVVVAATSTAVTGLSFATTFYLQVEAVNWNGVPSAAAPSTPLTAVTLPGPVAAGFSAGPGSGGAFSISGSAGVVTLIVPAGAFGAAVTGTLSVPASFPAASGGAANLSGTGVGLQVALTGPEPTQSVSLTICDAGLSLLNADNVVVARYDATDGVWLLLPTSVNTSSGCATASTAHLSLFQIMTIVAATDASDVRYFPNPLRPSQGQTGMTFSNLPVGATIKIFDMLGEKIQTLTANGLGMAVWDGRNSFGRDAATGVYFVNISGSSRTLKIAVQR